MSLDNSNDTYFNDGEVFFGKLTLDEIKYRILPSKQRSSTIGCSLYSDADDHDSSLKLIETTSEPSLLHINDSTVLRHNVVSLPDLTLNDSNIQSWNTKTSDESFIKMEHMVAEMCEADVPENECDNTFDEVERMLKEAKKLQNAIIKNESPVINTLYSNYVKNDCNTEILIHSSEFIKTPLKECSNIKKKLFAEENKIPEIVIQSPSFINTSTNEGKQDLDIFYTPLKSTEKLNTKKTVFKTPTNPSVKNVGKSSVKKTPLKYDYVKSPVASYIRDGPHVPFMKDVKPQKPLPGTSAIPKLIKAPNKSNKENIDLPRLAYRSAKKTKVTEVPVPTQLPKSQWAKNVESSLPRPMVIKHGIRENQLKTKLKPSEEDSFDNLSLHQADVSLCTLKPGTPMKLKK